MPFAHPLGRMRETMQIIRLACAGEPIVYQGKHYVLPRPGGEGKALRLNLPQTPHCPSIWRRWLPDARTHRELADGWIGTSFIPERATVFTERLAAGAARAGRTLADLDLSQGGDVAFSDDVEALVAARKSRLAFSLGGMGSATTNFYNDAYSRQGWADVAAEVRRLWVAGRRQDAAAIIPDAMVLQTTMLGTEAMVRQRYTGLARRRHHYAASLSCRPNPRGTPHDAWARHRYRRRTQPRTGLRGCRLRGRCTSATARAAVRL